MKKSSGESMKYFTQTHSGREKIKQETNAFSSFNAISNNLLPQSIVTYDEIAPQT